MNLLAPCQGSFVVFPLGSRRFALLTADVVELARTGVVQAFPHTMQGLEGVLVRRGKVLPVWNLAQTFFGAATVPLKYWLITRRNFAGEEWTAIPVGGECQMLQAKLLPASEGSAAYVRGSLLVEDRLIDVIDLSQLSYPPGPDGAKGRSSGTEFEEPQ